MRPLVFAVALLAPLLAGGQAGAETFRLTTLEWCPYTCSDLPGGGATTQVLRAALKAAGHDLAVDFLPWNRAVLTARREPGYAGYFPEYSGDVPGFTLSAVIGSGPLGVAERKDHPLSFRTVSELAAYRLGTVEGYLNTPDLDSAIAAGRQPVDETVSDTSNLLKLSLRRIDGAVIDGRVMAYLLAHDPALAAAAPALRFNRRVLEDKTLHVAAPPSETGRRMLEALALGLGRIDAASVQADYLARHGVDLEALMVALP